MTRILVFGMNQNPGGVESFLMNYYRQFNRSMLALDFLCNSNDKIAYEDELIASGANVYHVTARSKNPFRYYKELRQFFKKHAKDYQAIWVNINSLANIDYLKLAKKYGIPIRIVHSHNSRNMDSNLRAKLHYHNQKKIDKWATDFWACAADAAKWFYQGKELEQAKIIPNAIDVDKPKFSQEARDKIRKKYDLVDNYVLGNVGRLHFQKNQEFMLKVLKKLTEKRSDVRLVLIGQGEDEQKLKELTKQLELEEYVLFAGVQSNISEWLSAFDLFFFPSKFEGLPLAPFEAQANGLPTVLSLEGVPQEAKVNKNVYFYSLKDSEEKWALYLSDLIGKVSREDESFVQENFIASGYDIRTAGKYLESELLMLIGAGERNETN